MRTRIRDPIVIYVQSKLRRERCVRRCVPMQSADRGFERERSYRSPPRDDDLAATSVRRRVTFYRILSHFIAGITFRTFGVSTIHAESVSRCECSETSG
jgi:hypothetical protein